MKTIFHLIIIFALLSITGSINAADTCAVSKIDVERLPDLNIPRAGHEVFCVNGEITVAGGHTNGFVPTPTAEYLKDGQWHTIPMIYIHDFGFSVVLNSGKVMLGGGCEEPIGMGQTYVTETYDPLTHSFNGFCSMQRKRTHASALELDNGCVVVAGNWYYNDGIELFSDPKETHADYNDYRLFTYIKDVSVGRAYPLILRTAKDDALILGGHDLTGDSLWTTTAYSLKGDSVTIPLLEEWWPISNDMARSSESFIGDEAKGIYAYLVAVENHDGQVAIAKVVNGEFALLPTACPVPMQSHGEDIRYFSTILVDQNAGRGYLLGLSRDFQKAPEKPWRWYVLAIDYTKQPASLTLYYTDPLPEFNSYSPILTPEGNLLIAGGMYHGSNFTPSKSVLLLRVGREPVTAESGRNLWQVAILVLAALLFVALLLYLFIYRKRRDKESKEPASLILPESPNSDSLMERINKVMKEQKPYLNSGLKVSDIAEIFGVHRNDISACINSQMNCSFVQYINQYRIEYAKRLMRETPDKKISVVWMESGFGSEQTFFKIFKAATGMSPKEWISQGND